jgi:acetyl-CoA synthetase
MWEGAPDYPDKDIWWEICDRYDVTVFYTSPTAIRAAMKWGPEYPQKHDLSSIRLLGSVGEPINPKAWGWYHQVVGGGRCPIVDTWWQTETGQIMITPLPGITATKPGSATIPFPGVTAAVYDEDGNEIDEGQGLLVLTRPWPGMLRTLYQDDDRYVETYWDKFGKDVYLVGDAARKDEDGYIWVLGRVDDVVNVSGHRLSTAEIESAIVSFGEVAEAAEIRQHVAKKIGKFARPKQLIWAADLPKTRSGKIMRRLLRNIAEGEEVGDVTTLREPGVMDDLAKKMGSEDGDE